MNKFYLPLLIGIVLIGGFVLFNNKGTVQVGDKSSQLSTNESKDTDTSTDSTTQIPMIIDKTKKYSAVLKTTLGDITVELNAGKTPVTVNNFVSLSKKDFYNNTIFHRVVKGFMIQGGDPKGDGTGSPGYRFADEPFEGEYTRGAIAMANSGPNTNGSQFFIMHEDYQLPKNYVIFGKVIKGMEVVDKIAEAPVTTNPGSGETSKPVIPVTIKSVQIIEE